MYGGIQERGDVEVRSNTLFTNTNGTSRGSGELDGTSRGSGELDGTSRGSGELDGTSRGSGELDGTSRGSGELDGTSRGSGELDGTSGGSGELDGTSGGSGELDGTSGGTGELDGTSRGSGGHWRGAGTGGHWRGAGTGGHWRGAGTGGHWRDAGTGGHWRGAGTGGRWRGAGTGESEAPSGLDRTSGDDGGRRGGISYSNSVSQSIKSSSMSSSPRCIISSISAVVQGAELHSALTPSTAGSLVVGIVAGSRTRSDGLGRTSGDEDELGGASRDTSGLTWATNGPGLEVAANGGGSPANNRLDEPQTAAEIPRERRARTSRGRRRSIAAGAKPGNKNFQKREENKTGWKWHRGHCIFRSSILSRMYGGIQERGDVEVRSNTLFTNTAIAGDMNTRNDVNNNPQVTLGRTDLYRET